MYLLTYDKKPRNTWNKGKLIGQKKPLKLREIWAIWIRLMLIDYLCASAGGPIYYTGRDMKTSHKGMKITDGDWSIFLEHAGATMEALQVPEQECDEIVAFVLTLKDDIVEA